MPLPTPNKNEERVSFIQRCMGDGTMNEDYPDQEQRAAVCYSAWRDAHPSSKKPKSADGIIRKQYEIKNLTDRTILIMASDESIDRDGDKVLQEGWETTNFLKNGAIIYGHDKDKLPVAKPLTAEVMNKQLMIKAKFADEGTSEWTDAVYSLVQQGILKGVSVGFMGKEAEPNKETGGRVFKKQELVELSLTPIPSNANAMVVAKEFKPEIADKLIEEDVEKSILEDATELMDAIKSLRIWLTIESDDKEEPEEEPEDNEDEDSEDEESIIEETVQALTRLKSALHKSREETKDVEPEPKFTEAEMKLLEKLANLK